MKKGKNFMKQAREIIKLKKQNYKKRKIYEVQGRSSRFQVDDFSEYCFRFVIELS